MAGEFAFGTMIKDAFSVNVAELLAMAGFDYFVIDMEHAAYDIPRIYDILLYARKCPISSVVRIPVLEYSNVARALDMGAECIWVPHVDTPGMARDLVRFAKYPPVGVRGAAVPLFRKQEYQQAESATAYYEALNNETMLIAQIESREGVEYVEAIVGVDGIDVAMIGTQDLSLDMGLAGAGSHPDVDAAVQRVVDACKAHGKVSGNHLQKVEPLRGWMEQGMRRITYSYETNMIVERSRAALAELKQGFVS